MQIAVIADIHSNAIALAAVLDDFRNEGVDHVIQLGDAFNGPIDPQGVADLLKSIIVPIEHVRGNGERMVLGVGPEPATKSALFARARLSPDDLAFAATWPAVVRSETYLACHGSPRDDNEYLLENVTPQGVALRSPDGVAEILGPECAPLVLCGHSHVQRLSPLSDGSLVVNAGSVGLPAYSIARPVPHKMEAGSPHARYALAENSGDGWRVSLRAVPYDWEKAAGVAVANGFPEWAKALRTGFA